MMVGMDFRLTGQRYQMVIPRQLTLGTVMEAALALAKTEDKDSSCIQSTSLRQCRTQKPRHGKLAYVKWTRATGRPIDWCCSTHTQTDHQLRLECDCNKF